jgi:hypothetical protein
MKKYSGIILILLFNSAIFAQIHLTEYGRELQGSDAIAKDLSVGFVFQPATDAFENLYDSDIYSSTIAVDINTNERITIDLERVNLFTEDFRLRGMTARGRVDLEADMGKHYHGKGRGFPGSWVAFSI